MLAVGIGENKLEAKEMENEILEGAKRLLIGAASSNSTITYSRDMNGSQVETRDEKFVEKGNLRSEALWEEIIMELETSGLIKADKCSPGIFRLTYAGYKRADSWGNE